jgi:hypothetical protein
MRLEYVALIVWPWMFGLGCFDLGCFGLGCFGLGCFGLGYLARMSRSIGVRQTGVVASFAGGHLSLFLMAVMVIIGCMLTAESDVESKLVEALRRALGSHRT